MCRPKANRSIHNRCGRQLDPDGNAIAAWSGNTGELGGWDIVHAAYKPAGEGWDEPVPLSSEGGNGFPSDVVFDTGGNAALVWGRWDGAANLVQAAYKPAGEEWESAVDLSQEGKQGMDAVIVLDAPGNESAADGDATAVWVSAESVNCPEGAAPPCYAYEVQAAGYDPDGIPEVTVEAPAEGTTGEPVEVSDTDGKPLLAGDRIRRRRERRRHHGDPFLR